MLLNGEVMDEYTERGERIKDDVLLLILNSYWEPIPFTLPEAPGDPEWEVLVDTAHPEIEEGRTLPKGERYPLRARSLALLRQRKVNPESKRLGG
jgi:glycogen operon protein